MTVIDHAQRVGSVYSLPIENPSRRSLLFSGSGLSSFGNLVKTDAKIAFGDIPHFSPSTVEGHPGQLLLGHLEGVPVVVMQGRIHAYEGHSWQDVVFPIQVMAQLGAEALVVTNAAGGMMKKMKAGDLMIIKDHINLTGGNPLVGPNISELGVRFVDMTDPYEKKLRALLKKSLMKRKARHHEGVYVGLLGPTYETVSEVKHLQKIGGHAVGMSTVAEVIAARHAGLRVVGLSCITNLSTGLSKTKLTHDDVKETSARVEKTFCAVLSDFTQVLAAELNASK